MVMGTHETDATGPRYAGDHRTLVVTLALALACVALVAANLAAGSVSATPAELAGALLHPEGGDTLATIVWSIRLPRLVCAGLLGSALAISGLLLQTLFQNPIAGPFVLGISQGAKLAVAVLVVLVAGPLRPVTTFERVVAATLGAAAAMGASLAVSRRVSSTALLTLVGVMIGYLANAAADLIITFAPDSTQATLRAWAQGSFSGMGWADVAWVVPITCAGIVWALLLVKPLAAYLLGERYATSAGVDAGRFRVCVICLSSILSSTVCAFAGPVSFCGVAVPHIVRRLLNTSRPHAVLPACAIGGAAFCLLSDLIARTLFAPVELTISTVTAILGAPVVVAYLCNRRRLG